MNSLGLFSLLTLRSPHIPAGQSWPGTRAAYWKHLEHLQTTDPSLEVLLQLSWDAAQVCGVFRAPQWCYVGKVGRAQLEGDLQVSRAGVLRVPGTTGRLPAAHVGGRVRGRGTPGRLSGAPASALVSITRVIAPLTRKTGPCNPITAEKQTTSHFPESHA